MMISVFSHLYLFILSKADIRNPLRYLLMNAVTSLLAHERSHFAICVHMELIYLFYNFSVNVLNESKSADGSWTTDIVHSIFFTNRKSINVISSSELRIPVE